MCVEVDERILKSSEPSEGITKSRELPEKGVGSAYTLARLDRLLQRYGGDPDVVWAVERLSPRHDRVRRRNEAIKAAASGFEGAPTVVATAMARALAAYERTSWPDEQHLTTLPAAGQRHAALHRILRLTGGRTLGWQTIYNIFKE